METPPEFILFLDRAIAAKLVMEMLREQRVAFYRHDDLFAQNTPDTDWLPEIGKRQWFVVTQDQRIRYNPLEKMALLSSGIGAFIVVGKNLSGALQAACIRLAPPRMREAATHMPRPFIVKVYADGRLQPLVIS